MGILSMFKIFKKKEPAGFPDLPGEGPGDFGMPGEMRSDAPPMGGPEPLSSPDMPGISSPPGFEPTSAMGPEQPPAFGPPDMGRQMMPQASAQYPSSSDKDFQLLNAKLDAIKAGIDSLHQRLDKMEMQKAKEDREIYTWR